jgi:hypothetical protein
MMHPAQAMARSPDSARPGPRVDPAVPDAARSSVFPAFGGIVDAFCR